MAGPTLIEFKHRAPRCDHGFYQGLCADEACEHWDGARTLYEAAKRGRSELCGGRRRRKKAA